MLCKLAWGNVRRASRDYLIYLLTLALGVTVFYAFNTISLQVDIAGIKTAGMREIMSELLSRLTIFLAAVMGFLMVYANNFIMKRRKREFGLYQVLGMTRGQVARIMAYETLIVSGAALVLGIICGIALSQTREHQNQKPPVVGHHLLGWPCADHLGILPPFARRPAAYCSGRPA